MCSSTLGVFCVLGTVCAHPDTASAQGAARGMFHYRLERKAKIYLDLSQVVLCCPSLQPDGGQEPNPPWKSRVEGTWAGGRDTLVVKPLLGLGELPQLSQLTLESPPHY